MKKVERKVAVKDYFVLAYGLVRGKITKEQADLFKLMESTEMCGLVLKYEGEE